jgi:hypothetical protein
MELEIDHAVGLLISDKVIPSSTQCPYLVFATALIAALVLGSAADETAIESERVRINELNTALEHINRALKTLAPDREGIVYLAATEDEELFIRLADVVGAEKLISEAVKFLNENFERNYGNKLDAKKPPPAKRGRRPALDIRDVVGPCEDVWQQLIGARPGKKNVGFHNLLEAAGGKWSQKSRKSSPADFPSLGHVLPPVNELTEQ